MKCLQEALIARDVETEAAILGRLFIDPVAYRLALGREVREYTRCDVFIPYLDWHDMALSPCP